jgi:dCTP deaminase
LRSGQPLRPTFKYLNRSPHMLLSDREIKQRLASRSLIIEPLEPGQIQPNGVDLRVGDSFYDLEEGKEVNATEFTIRPGATVLVTSLERVRFPPDLAGLISLRSTYARRGLLIPPTVIDSGYEGVLTLAVRGGPHPLTLKRGEAIWYLLILQTRPVREPYKGRYQGARGLTKP